MIYLLKEVSPIKEETSPFTIRISFEKADVKFLEDDSFY
jgi:hypothetical protein